MATINLGMLELLFALDSPPPIIYHYTSMDALLSIVQSEKMRATHIRYLNDTSEADVIWHAAQKRLTWKLDSLPAGEARDLLSEIVRVLPDRAGCTDFVASFSENGDDLSQWRAYCPSGTGVSIGFHSEALRTQWVADPKGEEPKWVGGRLAKIRYLSDCDWSEFDQWIDSILTVAPGMAGHQNLHGDTMTATGFVLNVLTVFASGFKHAAFHAEREWRMVLSKPHKPMPFQRFRAGKSSIVPYVEAVLNRDLKGSQNVPYPIKEVRLSPTPDPALSTEAVNSLFLSLGQSQVEVHPSSIPFRHW
jgi:Protein of unknown function (DUF2971)